MRVPKRLFVFFKRNTKFESCAQTAVRFFIAKYKISKVVPKRPSVIFREIQDFENCTQTAIRFFHNKTQNFENCTQTAIRFFTTKYRILKVVPKRPFGLPTGKLSSI